MQLGILVYYREVHQRRQELLCLSFADELCGDSKLDKSSRGMAYMVFSITNKGPDVNNVACLRAEVSRRNYTTIKIVTLLAIIIHVRRNSLVLFAKMGFT